MGQITRPQIGQQSPVMIELVGPAGAGKTTLSRILRQRHDKFVIGADIELRKIGHWLPFLRTLPGVLPMVLPHVGNGQAFSWDEMKALAYLKGWHHLFRRQAAPTGTVVLLDHGPVFQMATLHGFGPERLRSIAADKWWNDLFRQWAAVLDLVIWLDAPDPVLEQRINTREQRHKVKGKTGAEVSQFLAQYRRSYEHVLARLSAVDGPLQLHYNTSVTAIDQIVTEVLALCHYHEANPRQYALAVALE